MIFCQQTGDRELCGVTLLSHEQFCPETFTLSHSDSFESSELPVFVHFFFLIPCNLNQHAVQTQLACPSSSARRFREISKNVKFNSKFPVTATLSGCISTRSISHSIHLPPSSSLGLLGSHETKISSGLHCRRQASFHGGARWQLIGNETLAKSLYVQKIQKTIVVINSLKGRKNKLHLLHFDDALLLIYVRAEYEAFKMIKTINQAIHYTVDL